MNSTALKNWKNRACVLPLQLSQNKIEMAEKFDSPYKCIQNRVKHLRRSDLRKFAESR